MIKVKNITYSYNRTARKVLEDVSFELERGQCLAVLGNNGAGKSTLLKCIDRICQTEGASVMIDGQDAFKMNSRTIAQNIAYVSQNTENVNMTVFDTVLLGRKPYIKWDVTAEDRETVDGILQKMGLEELALRNVSELSGGEAQKVMLARALAQEPKLLLLDEPTSRLDPYNQHEMLHVIRDIARERNIAVIIIIHDLNLAMRHCDRFLFLKDAGVFSFGGVETVNPETIKSVYGLRVDIIEHRGIRIIVPY